MALPTLHPQHVVQTIKRSILIVVIALVTFVGVMKVGVYVLDWQNDWALSTLRIVPLPAATVDWRWLPQRDYLIQLLAMRQYNTVVAKETTGVFTAASETELRQTTIRKLLRDDATNSLLKRFGISLTMQDIDRAFSAQLLQTGNQQATASAINELYGWTPEVYKHYVVRSAVAREKLREYLSFTAPHNKTAATQAAAVRDIVQAGETPFEELAKKYSEDAYALSGGDLGFIHRGEQDEVIEQAAWALEPGTTSELLHTKFGFHIIQVVEKQNNEGEEQVRIRQIFIAGPSVDQAITDELKRHRIGIWTKGYRWDAAKTDVVPS